MSAPIFIVIPEYTPFGENILHYLRPYDIIRISESTDGMEGMIEVVCKQGVDIIVIRTLLTANEIHARMQEMEEKRERFLWGSTGGDDE